MRFTGLASFQLPGARLPFTSVIRGMAKKKHSDKSSAGPQTSSGPTLQEIHVHVRPNSQSDSIEEVNISNNQTGSVSVELRVNVSAAPENNEANRAVLKLLSKTMKVPQDDISLAQGAKSRHKVFSMKGWTDEIAVRLKENS